MIGCLQLKLHVPRVRLQAASMHPVPAAGTDRLAHGLGRMLLDRRREHLYGAGDGSTGSQKSTLCSCSLKAHIHHVVQLNAWALGGRLVLLGVVARQQAVRVCRCGAHEAAARVEVHLDSRSGPEGNRGVCSAGDRGEPREFRATPRKWSARL